MIESKTAFIATGGNRTPSAADWQDDILVFGAGNNVAISNTSSSRIEKLLQGHTDVVTCIKIETLPVGRIIISGSSDRTVRLWRASGEQYELWQTIQAHEAAVNTVAIHNDLIVSGSADGTVKIWRIEEQATLVQTISLKPRFLPLTVAVTSLDQSICLAVAGTTTSIQLFTNINGDFTLQATLTGHEGWIRSLDFTHAEQDVILASASQDKLIRLWRFTVNTEEAQASLLSNKLYHLRLPSRTWTAQYDALLVGHEDWIYTVKWSQSQQLLSASADNSLAIWKYNSNLWICDVRLGEISAEKGATTATGSTGGFWIGLWGANDTSVVSLGRTGSWRRWSLSDGWDQQAGLSGHVKEVQSLSWARDGSYLLSTSLDQTTRLWTRWKDSWYEFSRPQIHGYDLHCIATLPKHQFVSGAEEKLLRVFNQPRSIGDLLSGKSVNLSNATIPMLGLSNKATTEEDVDTAQIIGPPFEDHLARFTLWPEHEKLYGHGYEISAVAANHAGTLIATSCKASSLDHAVIRLYETQAWREIRPALSAHSLTVTALAFSSDDVYLLSVGRDRQWTVFRRGDEGTFQLAVSNPAGHSRMILDCSWAPSPAESAFGHVFATAGRDKVVKLWRIRHAEADQIASFASKSAVTAVAFAPTGFRLAYGNEDGESVVVQSDDGNWQSCRTISAERASKSITSLVWRPGHDTDLLAIGSEDTSIRLVEV